MKISIVTVCRNSEKYIRNAMDSVLAQTYPDIEYIVVDGLSEDKTSDIVKEYEIEFNGRMRWISEKDAGLYDAMNKGFQMATGEVIGIINSDDLFIDKEAVAKIVECFNRNSSLDCVYGDLYYVEREDTDKIVRHWKTGERKPFNRGWHPAHPTFYVKKKIYEKYGIFDLDFKFAADFELMLRLMEKGGISSFYIPECFVKMRLGGTTNKTLGNIYRQNLECIRAFHKNGISVSVLYPFYRLVPKLIQYFR